MSKNVMIPISLLYQIIELLGSWDISNYDLAIRDDYNNILLGLDDKVHKLELREAYASIIRADNQNARDLARIQYLQQKRFRY